ncbi:hypothetical protein R5R35_009980 [Gryllus longicercus]|uniref:Amino acid transporter n=1 Tax=Gryllus longicercus TaxID=2509291 RepID=A0AAN9VFD3_9ORTH
MDKRLTAVTSEVYAVTMQLATWILWTAPVFLFFLVMADVMVIDDFALYFKTWGIYILTMHAVHLLIILIQYPLALFLLVRVNPFKFYYDMAKAIITAYVTSSSIACMPIAIDCLLNHGVDERIVRFVVPIGINLSKIGSASSLTVSLVFVAQMLGAKLSVGEYFTVVVLSILGSIVVPAVPFSGIAVVIMLLHTLGLAQNLVAGILAVEWINDRIGTTNNVLGNCVFPKILEKWNGKLLKKMDESEIAKIVRFVVPIGINLNKIGSACYYPICLIFVAQMLDAQLTLGQLFTVGVLSVLASIVTPAVPFSGIAVMIMLLNTLGLDQTLVAGILAVEWMNDRIATVGNVLGNCVFPKILEKWNRKLLKKMDDKVSEM